MARKLIVEIVADTTQFERALKRARIKVTTSWWRRTLLRIALWRNRLMAGPTAKLHIVSDMSYAPLEQLAFSDPDGETHTYVFTDDGKQNLISKLTGGLVIPGS